MTREYFFGKMRSAGLQRHALSGPPARRGEPDRGRIVKLFVGQGHGYIRVGNDRDVYFHRTDVRDGASINDLQLGDVVTFERIDDRVSGARALLVRRSR